MNGRVGGLKREKRRKTIGPAFSPGVDLRWIISNYDRGRLSAVPRGRPRSISPRDHGAAGSPRLELETPIVSLGLASRGSLL